MTPPLNKRSILNMRSTQEDWNSRKPGSAKAKSGRSPNASPATAARILTAATHEFAEHGFTRSTIRGIALAAEVSPGLVIHHFGSKDGLRTACDNHVFAAITEAKTQAAEYTPFAVQAMFEDPDMSVNIDYLVKSLLDPSDHGRLYFEHYVTVVEEYLADGFAGYSLRPSDDPRGQAAMIATLALAPALLGHRLQDVLGTSSTSETMGRLAPHLLDLYLNGILRSLSSKQPTTSAGARNFPAEVPSSAEAGPTSAPAPDDTSGDDPS